MCRNNNKSNAGIKEMPSKIFSIMEKLRLYGSKKNYAL